MCQYTEEIRADFSPSMKHDIENLWIIFGNLCRRLTIQDKRKKKKKNKRKREKRKQKRREGKRREEKQREEKREKKKEKEKETIQFHCGLGTFSPSLFQVTIDDKNDGFALIQPLTFAVRTLVIVAGFFMILSFRWKTVKQKNNPVHREPHVFIK